MLRKYVYRGKRKFLIMFPIDQLVQDGTEVVAKNKKEAELFEELGFEKVAEGADEIQKEEKEGEK